MTEVRVRFPPSPTGYLHIGGARTALLNWLYAKKTGGKLILRIEDTDAERSTKESIQGILDGLQWLGLDWDEGPYFQTEFAEDHVKAANMLLQSGHAYKCYCTKEELDGLKKKRQAATKEFEQHMKYLGLTLHRFELVENLSLALKKADISDEAVGNYLEQQAILDEAKFNMALFTAVVTKAKVVTAPDGGQVLLRALNEYGNLTGVCVGLKAEVKSLKGHWM